MAKSQVNVSGGETVSKWNNALEKLYEVAELLRTNFQITNCHYNDLINRIDHSGTFFYCDPPYPKEVRASFNDYRFEFTTQDHEQLADSLHQIKGLAMVSSYDSDMYRNLYKGWEMVKFSPKNNNIRSGKVQEVIWMNYSLSPKQISIFSHENKQRNEDKIFN